MSNTLLWVKETLCNIDWWLSPDHEEDWVIKMDFRFCPYLNEKWFFVKMTCFCGYIIRDAFLIAKKMQSQHWFIISGKNWIGQWSHRKKNFIGPPFFSRPSTLLHNSLAFEESKHRRFQCHIRKICTFFASVVIELIMKYLDNSDFFVKNRNSHYKTNQSGRLRVFLKVPTKLITLGDLDCQ